MHLQEEDFEEDEALYDELNLEEDDLLFGNDGDDDTSHAEVEEDQPGLF